jgi:hypothetical protein
MVVLPHSYGVGTLAECTCGANTYGQWHEVEFVNYCPLCHHSGYLGVFPVEGGDTEISCLNCGADYCSYDGWDKSGSFRAQLTVYVEPTPEPTVAENATVQPEPLTPLQIAQNCLKANKIF